MRICVADPGMSNKLAGKQNMCLNPFFKPMPEGGGFFDGNARLHFVLRCIPGCSTSPSCIWCREVWPVQRKQSLCVVPPDCSWLPAYRGCSFNALNTLPQGESSVSVWKRGNQDERIRGLKRAEWIPGNLLEKGGLWSTYQHIFDNNFLFHKEQVRLLEN